MASRSTPPLKAENPNRSFSEASAQRIETRKLYYVDINQTLAQALAHHQAGRLLEAEAGYRAVLAIAPNQPDALHLLGMVAHQAGNSTAGVKLIEEAISLDPSAAQFHFNLGQIRLSLKEPAKAQLAYNRAYQLQPELMPALNWTALFNQIGEQLMAHGDLPAAIQAFQRASDCKSDLPEPLNNLGLCFRATGDWKSAVTNFEKAIAREPSLVDPHLNLGVTLMEMGEIDRAVRSLEEAVRLRPDLAPGARQPRRGVAAIEGRAGRNVCRRPRFARKSDRAGSKFTGSP